MVDGLLIKHVRVNSQTVEVQGNKVRLLLFYFILWFGLLWKWSNLLLSWICTQINLVSIFRVLTDDQGKEIDMNFNHGTTTRYQGGLVFAVDSRATGGMSIGSGSTSCETWRESVLLLPAICCPWVWWLLGMTRGGQACTTWTAMVRGPAGTCTAWVQSLHTVLRSAGCWLYEIHASPGQVWPHFHSTHRDTWNQNFQGHHDAGHLEQGERCRADDGGAKWCGVWIVLLVRLSLMPRLS